MRLCVIRRKPSCSNGSYISHPQEGFFFFYQNGTEKPNVIRWKYFGIFFIFVIFYDKTGLFDIYLCLIYFYLYFFFIFFFLFFKLSFQKQSNFFDIFFIQRNMIEGRIKSLFVDLLLLIHTGLNLQTIIAIYGKKKPGSLSNGQSKEFYLLFRTVPTDARCKI